MPILNFALNYQTELTRVQLQSKILKSSTYLGRAPWFKSCPLTRLCTSRIE